MASDVQDAIAGLYKHYEEIDLAREISHVSQSPRCSGGHALVYDGMWMPPGAERPVKVAIKVLNAAVSQHSGQAINLVTIRRLRQEISVWRRLRHRNVQEMHGLLWRPSYRLPAMVSTWQEEGDINTYVAKILKQTAARKMTERQGSELMLNLLGDVLNGLIYLHGQNVVHADIKGANVLVTREGSALLCDFGIAWTCVKNSVSFSLDRDSKGTFRWMAPELFRFSGATSDDDADAALYTPASDIWSYGCLFLEVQSQSRPYGSSPDQAVIIALFQKKLPPRPPRMHDRLWEFVEYCCVVDVPRRPSAHLVLRRLLRLRAMLAQYGKYDDIPILDSDRPDESSLADREKAHGAEAYDTHGLQYHTDIPQELYDDLYSSDSDPDDSSEETEEYREDDRSASQNILTGTAGRSPAYERQSTKAAVDPSFTSTPYRPPPAKGPVPASSTSQRNNPPVASTRVETTSSSARPIPVPPSRSESAHHEFNASVGVGLGSSPSSGSRMPAHYPTTSNSSFGAGSYGSGSDRGSLGDRGAKHRPPVHDEWRVTDAAVVSSSPATTTTKPQRRIPPPNASPQSTPSAPPRQPSIEALLTSHSSPIARPSTSPTVSMLRREASSTALRTDAHAHTHTMNLGTIPEPDRAPSTPSPVTKRKEKIWQPPASDYEREHQEAAANLRERERERERDSEHEGTTPLHIPHHESSTMSGASTGTTTRTIRPGSSASVYVPDSPAQYSRVVPASSAIDSRRPPSMDLRSSSVASSNRDSMFSAAATENSYTSLGTAFLHGHTISESPPSSPQLFTHGPNALHPPPREQTSMSQPARTPTSPGAPLASVARDLADDAEEWVRVLRAEHVARFEAHKKLAQLELEAKILDVAKWEAEAIVRGNGNRDEADDVRLRAREDFTQQMQTLAAFQDRQLHEAIASREGSGPQNVDIWEENLRAEQEIIMQQIARERRTRVGSYSPSSADPPSSRQATSSSTTGTSIQRHDGAASSQFLERNAERRASGLQRQLEEVEERERQIEQEREEARRREAALTRKRDAAVAEAVQQRRLDEVQRQQAAASSSTSSPRTPQSQGSGPIPIPVRSRKATVQSESEGDTEQEDDDEVQEEEDASRSSDEEQAQPHSSRAPSRNTTFDSPSAAPTAAPIQSRPQSARQGSAAIDTPAPKTQRKGESPPNGPPVARYGSYSTDSAAGKPGPGLPKTEPAEEEDKPLLNEREHRPYSQSFVNERTAVRRPSNATPSPFTTPSLRQQATAAAQAQAQAGADARERERQRREAEDPQKGEREKREVEERQRRERERRELEEREKQQRERELAKQSHEAEQRDRLRQMQEAEQRERLRQRLDDDESLKKEQEFSRRAEEAKNRYQERKRAEDEEKERRRLQRAAGGSRRPGSTPYSNSGTSGFPGAAPQSGSVGGAFPAWSSGFGTPGTAANEENWRATTSMLPRRWIPPTTTPPPFNPPTLTRQQYEDPAKGLESGVRSSNTPPWDSASRPIRPRTSAGWHP